MRNSVSNFRESGIPHPPRNGEQLQAASSSAGGRGGAGLGRQGLFGGARRKEQRLRRYCDSSSSF